MFPVTQLIFAAEGQSDLTGVVVLRVEKVAELRQQLGPRLQLPLGGDGRDQDALGEKRKHQVMLQQRPRDIS